MDNNAILPVEFKHLDMEMAAWVAQRYVLKELYLVDAKISRDPLTGTPETLSLEHKCFTDVLTPLDAKKYIVLCNFRVAAFDGKEPTKLIMKIEAAFCTSYVGKSLPGPFLPDDDDDDETFPAFILHVMTLNPIYHSWPYWREFVQNMSARMGFPALTVPLLEIAAKKAAMQEPESQPVKKQTARRKKVDA
ncbi:MAG: hypothetical protein Q7O12_15330 [Deltaproteobacteria bacterium]|nr:hypothetical protein [Deltaproteobacteria bacterium]